MSAPAFIIAAPSSGSGKTLLTLSILRALSRQGLQVGSFKVGPDYIDPSYHQKASGVACYNIDTWAMRLSIIGCLLTEMTQAHDLIVGEGVMGLFDGTNGQRGSTAELAEIARIPVVLVVDSKGMGISAAALVSGFVNYRPHLNISGIIFNRVGSDRHAAILTRACQEARLPPVIGCVRKHPDLHMPSRHLGLVPAGEMGELDAFLDRAADHVSQYTDMGRLIAKAGHPQLVSIREKAEPLGPLGQRIAIADDQAFCFTYPSIARGWQHQGAEILPFSPLADEAPDPTADAIYLPGGYPELHAGRLAANARWKIGLHDAAKQGKPVYGECGGYMVLGETLIDADGTSHAMLGLLKHTTSFAKRRLHLGMRAIRCLSSSPLGKVRAGFRGHEFHYATLIRNDAEPLFEVTNSAGLSLGQHGGRSGSVMGSFMHLMDRSTIAVDS